MGLGLGSRVLLGQDGPLLLRKAGSDEPAQLTASAALLGVATACMGTAYARLLKAAVTFTWKTAPVRVRVGLGLGSGLGLGLGLGLGSELGVGVG